MSELKELKRRKEDFRIEIRKNKQDKTLNANRQKLIQRLFEEEDTTSSSSTSSQEKGTFGKIGQLPNQLQQNNNSQMFGISSFDSNNKQTNSFAKQNNQMQQHQTVTQFNPLKVYVIYSLQEIGEMVFQFLDYVSKSTQLLLQSPASTSLNQVSQVTPQDFQIAQNMLREILVPLIKYEDLFKQINDKNCHLFEQGQVHIRLFEYLQTIILQMQVALSLDLQGAEALLSKVFQFLVNVCLNSDKALDDCFSLNIINYFINVMISSNFYTQKSKMILFSVNLLDHIASRNRQDHIKMLTEKEITRQILTLMADIRKSILTQAQQVNQTENILQQSPDLNINTENSIEVFYRRLLVHLSSILSNISRSKELIDSTDKTILIETCQQLLEIICKDLNERNKQTQTLKKFYQTIPQNKLQQEQVQREGLEEEEQDDEELTTDDTFSKEKKSPSNLSSSNYRSIEEQKNYEELAQIENNLGSSILNIIELMEAEELDEYISNNISFLVFVESQIVAIEEQNVENSQRIQVYGELVNGLLMGDADQIELVMETFQILDYIRNMLYSPYQNLVITGLSCLYNILISASTSQFDQIYDNDKNIVCRLLHLINNYCNNLQLQTESLNTFSAFVDRAPKFILDFTLRPSNIMNIIIQKMDPANDSAVIKAALGLLESLLKSEENNDEDDQDFDEENDDMDGNNENQMVQQQKPSFKTLSHSKDNYWSLKFQSNPAGNHQVTKLFNSCHSKDIILKLDSILDEYME